MTCIPTKDGILCIGNEALAIEYNGKVYLFEWCSGCGWMHVNLDGSERLSPVPVYVSNKLGMM